MYCTLRPRAFDTMARQRMRQQTGAPRGKDKRNLILCRRVGVLDPPLIEESQRIAISQVENDEARDPDTVVWAVHRLPLSLEPSLAKARFVQIVLLLAHKVLPFVHIAIVRQRRRDFHLFPKQTVPALVDPPHEVQRRAVLKERRRRCVLQNRSEQWEGERLAELYRPVEPDDVLERPELGQSMRVHLVELGDIEW